jgi:hypothetical protein
MTPGSPGDDSRDAASAPAREIDLGGQVAVVTGGGAGIG